MKTIRAGRGLGDSLYLQAVCRHLVKQGNRLEIRSDWPDVFRPLGDMVRVIPFGRNPRCDIVAHYASRKHVRGTSQFEDCFMAAGIEPPFEIKLDWPRAKPLETDKPVILVALPRQPMDRKDGYGKELLPDCSAIQKAIDRLKGRAFLVQVGQGIPLYEFNNLDLDLSNKTSIPELLDLASVADGFLGYCSFFIPLAESLGKPLLCVWSSAVKRADSNFIRLCAPQKILHPTTSRWIMDNASDQQIKVAVDELLEQIGNGGTVHGEVGRASWERAGVAG